MSIDNHRIWTSAHECAVCGSKAVGINFGTPTCAPCKAFFRRNARRREVLQMPCQISDSDSSINENQYNNNSKNCSQLRRCTSCRLRRCFNVGMKEELVRTDEEKQRYKQLIETNRQRRNEIIKSKNSCLPIPQIIVNNKKFLEEKDWKLLSNIVNAYDNYCLKIFIQNRTTIFNNEIKSSQQILSKIDHHIATRVNTIKSYLSFLSSIPIIQTLSRSNRYYLCQHNIRPLILLNIYEIEQTCFSESWQLDVDNTAAEYVYGKILYDDCIRIKNKATSILINDPVVTRLLLLILFFSTPLNCYYDLLLPEIIDENRSDLNQIQNSFTTLLWNYLIHRHSHMDAVRIFSNFIRIYLQIQRFSRAVNHETRTRNDLFIMNQALNQATIFEKDI